MARLPAFVPNIPQIVVITASFEKPTAQTADVRLVLWTFRSDVNDIYWDALIIHIGLKSSSVDIS